MQDNPEGGKLDPTEGICRRCKKNSSSVLSCIGKRTRECCDVAAKSELFTTDDAGRASSSEETEGIGQKKKL